MIYSQNSFLFSVGYLNIF